MKSLFVFLCAVFFSSYAYSSSKNLPINEEIPAMEFYIPDKDLPELERKALDGDINSSGKLRAYFGSYKNNYTQERFWLQIGAENGSPEAQNELASSLLSPLPSRSSEVLKQDHQRACFWLRKAIADRFPIKYIYAGYLKTCGIGSKE